MRRGETVEVSSPSASLNAGPRLRERPLGRCHTLDSGEQTPEQPEPTHTPNTTENTPQESNQTGVTHTPKTTDDSLSAGVQTSRDTDDTQPDASETHSTDDCSTVSETSPSSPSNAPLHAENSSESPPTLTSTNHSASPDPAEQSRSLRPLNGELESSDDQSRTENEASQAESKDGDSSPTCPADLHPPAQTGGVDQRDVDQTPETSPESSPGAATEMETM